MSSIRFTSFGAATVPLSKVIVDKDLDMGPYAIKGVYRPEEWPTETLEWGDTAPSDYSPMVRWVANPPEELDYELFTNTGPGAKFRVKVYVELGSYSLNSINIKVNGRTVVSRTEPLSANKTYESPAFSVDTGHTVVLSVTTPSNAKAYTNLYYQCTGEMSGAKTFDLTGKWLALGIDMHGLDATVKIHGEEVPYSEYVKAFPLVPTELKIPGEWDLTQERPVIKVYKGVYIK